MNILAIIGSPRKNGFTNKIVKEIIKGAEENNHHCEIIYLSDLNIRECAGCRVCQDKGMCVFRDDIVKIEEGIKNNSLIIWASPTRWGNISALMLRTFERLFGFLIKERPLALPVAMNALGKKAILVTSCSTQSPFDWIFNQSRACFGRMKEMCKYSGQKIVGTFVLPGTITMKEIPEKYLKKARKLGLSI